MSDKNYQIKIYSNWGETLVGVLDNKKIISISKIKDKLNSGVSDFSFDLSYDFTKIPPGLINNNIIVLRSIYDDVDTNTREYKIEFTGIIEEVNPATKDGVDTYSVKANGLYRMFSFSNYKDGASYTVSHTNVDPADIVRDIVDHLNTIYPGDLITYDEESIQDVGVLISYDFENLNHDKALQKVFEFADPDYFLWLSPAGKLHFKQLPTTATHSFKLNKHVTALNIKKNIEGIINQQHLTYDGGLVTVQSSESIAEWGLREPTPKNDGKITDSTTALQVATKIVAENRNQKDTIKSTVNSKYNIEGVDVGEAVKYRNFNNDNLELSDKLIIDEKTNNWDSIDIELTENPDDLFRELVTLFNRLQ